MTKQITLDFETRSKADIRKVGAWRYSIDPSTTILCLAYKLPNGLKTKLWTPNRPLPVELFEAMKKYKSEAHNAFFELSIWENVGVKKFDFAPVPRNFWLCSAAMASALALPRSLDGVGEALKLPIRKDKEGHRLMLKLSKPRKPTKNNPAIWHDEAQDFVRLYQYCIRDVDAELMASNNMEPLPDDELLVYELDKKINLRGVPIDKELAEKALEFTEQFSKVLNDRLLSLTNYQVEKATQRDRMLQFLEDNGYGLPDLTAKTVDDALSSGWGDPLCREVLSIRQMLSKSSTKKIDSMLRTLDPSDNRVRGTLLYHGASTGRFSGRLIQPQNFPRGILKDVNGCIDTILNFDFEFFKMLYPNVLGAISSILRGMIKAPDGFEFLAADFSAIEARVLFWLAGCPVGLHIYNTHGKAYEEMAAFIHKTSIDQIKKGSKERFLGKEVVLGCGYGMGAKTFLSTCKMKGFDFVTKQIAEVGVKSYREKFKTVPKFWKELNNAAIKAIQGKGRKFHVGKISFYMEGRYLKAELPNGRRISYCDPYLETTETSYGPRQGICFMGVDTYTKKWSKQRTYGGKLAENIVQAVARDIMIEAMFRVEDAGAPVIMSVHDEIVSETPTNSFELEEYERLMKVVPIWAKGCPLDAEGWKGNRFKK